MNCHSRLLHPTPAPTYATLSAPPIHCTARELVFGDPDSSGASLVLSAGKPGLVPVSDTHRDTGKEMSWVTSLLIGASKCL